MPRRAWLVLAAMVCVPACGGGGSPSAPTPPPSSATVTGISLSALEFVRLNAPQRLALNATMSDGTTRVVEGTWQSSDPAVATVAGDGLVTGISSGEVIVTAQYQSHRTDRRLRIVPDYAGDWDGGYRLTSCADGGDWDGFCESDDPDIEWSLALSLAQAGGEVTGLVRAFEDITVPVVGIIATNGRLSLVGEVNIGSQAEPFIVRIANWDTGAFDDNRLMNGKFEVVGSAPDLVGEFRYFCEVTVLNKVRASSARPDRVLRHLVTMPRPPVPLVPR